MRRESLPARVRRAFRLELHRTHGRWIEEELDEEIRFHLEQRITELVNRGWTRADANHEALARFGPYEESRRQMLNSARKREEVLTMWGRLENVRLDLRYALRQLARSPGLSAAVALTFALGIGVNATMFTVIDRVLLRPPAYVLRPETIMQVVAGRQGEGYGQRTLNYPVFKAIRDHAAGLTDVTAIYDVVVPVGRGQSASQAQGQLVTTNYFKLLGVTPRMGRVFRPEEDAEPLGAPIAVVSYDYWQAHLSGDERVIGRTLPILDRQFTVIGVMPPGFTGLGISGPDVWLPMSAGAAKLAPATRWSTNANGSWLRVLARLEPHVPAELAAANAMRVTREVAPHAWFTGKTWSLAAQPIMSLRGAREGMTAAVTRLLAAMSFIVLIVACANVANLLLARGLRRREEIAVRLALGVSRARLVSSLLVESALLALIGGAVALIVAYWGSRIVFNLLFTDTALHASMADGRVLAFTGIVTITIGVLTGLLPALQASRTELAAVLKSGSRDTGHRSRTRSALLVTQAALSVVLLFAAGLFVRSLANLTRVRMGVDIDRVALGILNLEVLGYSPHAGDDVMERTFERVRALPGVSHAALAMTAPFGASDIIDLKIRGRDSIVHAGAMFNAVSPEYFKTLGARLLRGRDFSASDDAGAQRVLIVNETFATRYWGKENPIGQCVGAGDGLPCAEVIGVVENVRRQSIFEDSTGAAYLPLAQTLGLAHPRQLLARIDGANPTAMLEPMRIAMQAAAPQLPYANVHLLADAPIVRQEFRPYRLGALLFAVFGLLALALAAIGIYGVVSYNVGQRTREMGVRIALGAPSGRVARLVIAEGVAVTLIGVVIGVLLAVTGAGLAQPLLVDEPARDPLLLLGVGVVLVATAIAASALPALRAVRTDPAIALRSE